MSDITTERPGHGGRRRASKPRSKPRAKPAPAPQTRRPDVSGRRVATPRRPAPSKTTVKQARAQERSYGSPRVSDRMARDNRRTAKKNKPRRERLLMQARRRKYFPKDALRAGRRSQRSALEALADLRSQDPEKYERRQHSWLHNAARDVGDYVERSSRQSFRDEVQGRSSGDSTRRLVSDAGGVAGRGIEASGKWAGKQLAEGERVSKKAGLSVPVVDKLAQEALDIAANTPAGVYMTGDAAVSAAKGDSRKLKKLGKEFEKSSALVPLVKGDLKEAGKRAADRPLTTFLEASGVKALVGRGGGAALRHAPSGRLRQAGSTERAPQRLYTDAETKQRTVKGKVPVGGKRGPAVNRHYSRDIINKGIQVGGERIARRRARDPNVDHGNRVVPGRKPWRRQLDREVDRQVFSAARAMEQRRVQAAKRANKATGKERAQLLVAARADKIRAELREAIRLTPAGPKKRAWRALIRLSDRKLIAKVEHGSAPRMKNRTQRQSRYSKDEQAMAIKAIDKRARRGKPLGPQLAAALKDAGERHVKRDVAARNAVAELPGAGIARAIAQSHGGSRYAGPERRSVPRPGQPSPLIPEDFAAYFETARHLKSIPPKRVAAPEAWQHLAGIRAVDSDIMPTAVARAVNETAQENAKLVAKEFGIPVGKRGYVSSHGAAERQAYKVWRQDPSVDLIPLRVEEGKYVLAPRQVMARFDKHAHVDRHSPTGTAFDTGTRLFKDVVLTTSSPSRWLGGNVGDIGMRSLNEGLTPFDVARGYKIGERMQAQELQGEQAWSNMTGGGLMGISDDLAQLSPLARWNMIGRGWRGWKRTIYTLEHSIEKTAQAGRVGKSFRRDNQRTVDSVKGLLKMQDEALDLYAQGLSTSRAFEARVAREVENLIGRWGKVSPGMRRSLALAPFAQWLGASVRYVYVTLPVHHPIKTGILAGIMQMTEPERRALGLSYFAEPADRAPDYQMGLLPNNVLRSREQVREYAAKENLSEDETERLMAAIKHGPILKGTRTSRMTSFGTAANPGDWPGFALPQFAGAFDALTGTSFTGEPLEYPADYPEKYRDIGLDLMDRLPVAAGAQLETAVPFASMFRRAFLEGGQPSEPFSTILTPSVRKRKDYNTGEWIEPEGSWQQGLKKWLSPVAPEGRVYTLGAQRDIDATQKAMRKIEQWNEERARTKSHIDPFGPEVAPAVKKKGQHVDPFGEQPKKLSRRPQETHVDPFR